MSYADKCFFFDFNNREIKLQDSSEYEFGKYESISLRKRWVGKDDTPVISIELQGKEKKDGEREEDEEIMLSRDDAMVLASKLTRAVAELDADLYRQDDIYDLRLLNELHWKEVAKEKERREKNGYPRSRAKGGIMGALKNYVKTPMGKDQLKKQAEKN